VEVSLYDGTMVEIGEAQKSVTGRAFTVLDTFDAGHRHQTLAQIARRAGLPLTTAHRLVHELVAQGALSRTPDGAYEIGRKIWSLGILASLHSDLRELALPYMEDLYQLGNDAVQIGVLDGFRCLIVERIAGSRTLSVISKPGARLPLHASGVGKVLLAYGSKELQEAVLDSLESYTDKTVTDPEKVRKQLKQIKDQGFAHSEEELAIGARTLAAPIFGPGKKVVAALGIVSPVDNREIMRIAPLLQVSANALSKKLIAAGVSKIVI
jgi:DNA-binding IclR family transcriptional regulator